MANTSIREQLNKFSDIEVQLRMIIAYARNGDPIEPKDIYVQQIMSLIATHYTPTADVSELVRAAKEEENDYHWHRQRHITKQAGNGTISMYFLERIAELQPPHKAEQ